MATTITFKWNSAGFRKILKSPGVGAVLLSEGERIGAGAQGEGRSIYVHTWAGSYGGGRTICSVNASGRDADTALLGAV